MQQISVVLILSFVLVFSSLAHASPDAEIEDVIKILERNDSASLVDYFLDSGLANSSVGGSVSEEKKKQIEQFVPAVFSFADEIKAAEIISTAKIGSQMEVFVLGVYGAALPLLLELTYYQVPGVRGWNRVEMQFHSIDGSEEMDRLKAELMRPVVR